MRRARRRSRAVAAIAALALFTQMVAPIGVTAAQAGAKPAPTAQAGAPTKSASQAVATPEKAAAAASPIVDGGWPRIYDLPSGGTHPRLSAAGRAGTNRHMSSPSAPCRIARTAAKSRPGHDQARGGHQRLRRRAPGRLPEDEDCRSELPGAAEGADARDCRPRSTRRFLTTSASSRSIACSRTSTRARSSRRTSRASRPIRRRSSSARRRR